MRKEILEWIHDGHMGITKCREHANQLVWWPHVSKDIQDRVATCGHCLEKQPSQAREPMLPSSLPDRPFQKVDVDLCEFKGLQYLVIVDYYSRYIDLAHLPNIMSSMVVNKMKNSFAHHGIPETVISDNGTQFTSAEFKTFSVDWNFQHVTSSLHYPQSNREAERAVKTAKELLKQDDIFLALLTYCSTPIQDLGAGPAELVFGRRLQTMLPSLLGTLTPHTVNQETLRERDAAFKQKRNYNRHHGVRPLPELHPGNSVFIKSDGQKGWKLPAEMVQKCAPRSYIVQSAGGQLRRSRKHLQQRTAINSSPAIANETTPGQAFVPDRSMGQEPQGQQSPSLLGKPPDLQSSGQPPSPSPSLGQSPQAVHGSSTALLQPSTEQYHTRSGRVVVKPARFIED